MHVWTEWLRHWYRSLLFTIHMWVCSLEECGNIALKGPLSFLLIQVNIFVNFPHFTCFLSNLVAKTNAIDSLPLASSNPSCYDWNLNFRLGHRQEWGRSNWSNSLNMVVTHCKLLSLVRYAALNIPILQKTMSVGHSQMMFTSLPLVVEDDENYQTWLTCL